MIEVNGQKVKNSAELRQKIGALSPKSTAKLQIIRSKKRQTVDVKLGERPNEGASIPASKQETGHTEASSDALKDYGISSVTPITDACDYWD